MRTASRAAALRWLVPPLAAMMLLGAGWSAGLLTASAHQTLPPRTAAQLLADVARSHLDGLSGTVVQKAELGLPALPNSAGSSDLGSLVSGTHTLKVWLSAPNEARVALLGTLGESDVVVNGRDQWTWSSRDHAATHATLSRPQWRHGPPDTGAVPLTPDQAARRLLAAIEPSTRVETTRTTTVAGRAAYELLLTPRDRASLIGQVRLAIDGTTHVPLRVQVLARGGGSPAYEIGYTSFDPSPPDASRFDFRPPPGAKVTEKGTISPPSHGGIHRPDAGPGVRLVGHGWATVAVAKVAPGSTPVVPGQMAKVLRTLPRVSGPWGSGRLLRGTLFSILLTDDGRIAVGAVAPEQLYGALATR